MRLSAKISSGVTFTLAAAMLLGVAAFVVQAYDNFHSHMIRDAENSLTIFKAFHTQSMLNRGSKLDDNPVIATMNSASERLNKASDHLTLWLVMSPKLIAFQKGKGFKEIEPPKDDIDREAIATGQPVSRMTGKDFYRLTVPAVLGQGPAAQDKCFECHGKDMGFARGEVIGAYSISLSTKEGYNDFITLSWVAFFIAVAVCLVISAVSIHLLNRTVSGPLSLMTGIMSKLAGGDSQVDIPDLKLKDEIGDMAKALVVFKDNLVKRIEAEEMLEIRVAELMDTRQRVEAQGAEVAQLAEELAWARDEAVRTSRAKSSFLAAMSHELRTPLNAIIGFSQMMKAKIFGPMGDLHYEEYAKDILASGEHLLELINDVLDLSKVEAGKMELCEEDVDVSEAISTSLDFLKESATESKVELITKTPKDLPKLYADSRLLKQIMINLLSNAVKFTPEGGKVTVSAAVNGGGELSLTVADTGIGISKENLTAVMTPFGQVDSSLARKHKGSGLGVPLVKELVEMHGGAFTLQSEVGKGTVATVVFPPERVQSG